MSFLSESLTEDCYLVIHEVGPGQRGIRLDAFLKKVYHSRSREQVKRFIDDGKVTLRRRDGGAHVMVGRLKPSLGLLPGDQVEVMSERKPEPEVNFDYKLLFEDDVIFVIEKPANLPVHPAGRYFFNTLLVHLKTHAHKTPYKTDREFFLVHRIDKETSGILVLAKNREVCTHLTRQFADRSTEKRYLAIVRGVPPEMNFEIDLPMKRDEKSVIKLKMRIASTEEEGGQSARTAFKCLEVAGLFALLECRPKTGRQHQIRVHLDHVGLPIVGDKLYGLPESESIKFYEREYLTPETEAKLLLPRHALHSAELSFTHPTTEERLTFRSELPGDMQAFLRNANISQAVARADPS